MIGMEMLTNNDIMLVSSLGYIDPGSGSAIMSVIIGFFVAIGLALKTYWYKLKGLFTGEKSSTQKDASATQSKKEDLSHS